MEPTERLELTERHRQACEALGQLGLIVTAVLLSYHTLATEAGQLERLLDGLPPPDRPFDPAPYRLAASTLVIKATSYFYGLSLGALERADEEARGALELDTLINAMALCASALRLLSLLGVVPPGEGEGDSAAVEERRAAP